MSFASTTLSSAVGLTDTNIVVASASGIVAGMIARFGGETLVVAQNYQSGTTIPVRRGQDSTAVITHPSGESITFGLGSDWQNPAAQTVATSQVAGRARLVKTYSADGAIDLPTSGADQVAILDGTVALNMTLAAPGKELNGSLLYIFGNGKAAHVVTVTTDGIGGGGSNLDTLTFAAGALNGLVFMAQGALWALVGGSVLSGTLTNITITAS